MRLRTVFVSCQATTTLPRPPFVFRGPSHPTFQRPSGLLFMPLESILCLPAGVSSPPKESELCHQISWWRLLYIERSTHKHDPSQLRRIASSQLDPHRPSQCSPTYILENALCTPFKTQIALPLGSFPEPSPCPSTLTQGRDGCSFFCGPSSA